MASEEKASSAGSKVPGYSFGGAAALLSTVSTACAGKPWVGPFIAIGVVLLALLGMPLFATMGGGTALWILDDHNLMQAIAEPLFSEQFAKSKILVTIPLYTFVGYLLAESKCPDRLVRAARAYVGWLPGGLAIVCIIASAVFTLLTGGSGVTIIAVGGLLYPALRKQKYSDKFSLGLVSAGGSVGLLLPLSLPLLVYGYVAKVDVDLLWWRAVLIPGVIVIVMLVAYSVWVSFKEKIPRDTFRLAELRSATWELRWELAIPVILVGGLVSHLADIDEIAGIVAAYVLAIETWITKDLRWKKDLLRIVRSSIGLAGAILIVLAMASVLMHYAVLKHGVPNKILAALKDLGIDQRWQLLIVINLFLLLLGMLMEGFTAIIVAVPLVLPLVAHLGRDPIHSDPSQMMSPFQLAMIFVLNLELAFCLPPLGLNLFIASFRFNRPVTSMYRVILPFVGILAVALLLVSYIPGISTSAVKGDIQKARDAASGQVRYSGVKPMGAAEKAAVDAAEAELKVALQEKLAALSATYRGVLVKTAPAGSYPYVSFLNGGMVDLILKLEPSGATEAVACTVKVGGKDVTVDPQAYALCGALTTDVKAWQLPKKLAEGPLAHFTLTLFLQPPSAPKDAWNLECVQIDTLNPLPCTQEDLDRFGNDGQKQLPLPKSASVPTPTGSASAKPPTSPEDEELMREMMGGGDAGTGAKPGADAGESDDDELMREMMGGGDAGAPHASADAGAAPAPSASGDLDDDALLREMMGGSPDAGKK